MYTLDKKYRSNRLENASHLLSTLWFEINERKQFSKFWVFSVKIETFEMTKSTSKISKNKIK